MSLVESCGRCSARVRPGDHLCTGCAEKLRRSTLDPWWGDFADHPDAKVKPEDQLTKCKSDPFLKRMESGR